MPDKLPYRFVPNPNAPEIFIHHLHDVRFINGIARFEPVAFRHDGSEIIGEPPCYILMEGSGVEPALELTYERLPNGVIIPALGRRLLRAVGLH